MATVLINAPALPKHSRTRDFRRETAVNPRSAAPKWTLSLTRRGRIFATLLVSAVAATALVIVGQQADAISSSSGIVGETDRRVIVQPGDTLWQIAQEYAPTKDPRGVVEDIRRANGLGTNVISPGQALIVPGFG